MGKRDNSYAKPSMLTLLKELVSAPADDDPVTVPDCSASLALWLTREELRYGEGTRYYAVDSNVIGPLAKREMPIAFGRAYDIVTREPVAGSPFVADLADANYWHVKSYATHPSHPRDPGSHGVAADINRRFSEFDKLLARLAEKLDTGESEE